ncbi:MAG: hypothetical protein C0410_06375 [Anaerolinea sp.]|nr:hypothetical protein [Anaerolinea sp.]
MRYTRYFYIRNELITHNLEYLHELNHFLPIGFWIIGIVCSFNVENMEPERGKKNPSICIYQKE